ncbi:MAG: amidohydrolase [Spirochaetaceae bacterium]|jgi:predicted amidohydrolase YtcJ|nr:amidohydrolase [Spirochaetaceae bacterium]
MVYADAIFVNGNIYTLDDDNPRARALALWKGKFLEAGDREDCEIFKGPDTRVVDLEGKTVLPGFNDTHCHLLSLRGQQLLQLDCSSGKVKSIDDILGIVKKAAETTPEGQWILAGSLDTAKLAEKRPPTRGELDKVSPRHPVHIRTQSCHIGIVNSRGFSLAGITRDTPNPPGGEFEKDSQGELTGICKEEAHFLFVTGMGGAGSFVPPYTPEQYLKALELSSKEYNRYGITSVGDALTGPPEIRAYTQAYNSGTLTVRVYMIVLDINLPLIKQLGLSSGFGNEWIRMGGIKSFVDGAIAGHTAWVSEPYRNRPDYYGIPTKTPEEIEALVMEAHGAGMQMEIHANGDRAIEMVLDAYEKAQKAIPRQDPRHRIAHCTVVNDKILERIKRLGVVVCPFVSYVWEHGDKMGPYGDRIERMFAHRSFLDRGIPVGASSDNPCGTQHPYQALQAMVTRVSSTGESLGLNQKVSLEEALKIYTQGSAYATFEENRKGKLSPGMLADFIVISQDPFTIDPFGLHELQTLQTYVGGKLVYDAR